MYAPLVFLCDIRQPAIFSSVYVTVDVCPPLLYKVLHSSVCVESLRSRLGWFGSQVTPSLLVGSIEPPLEALMHCCCRPLFVAMVSPARASLPKLGILVVSQKIPNPFHATELAQSRGAGLR